MPTSLENQFISDTYKGVLHTNNIVLSSGTQMGNVYDGLGYKSSLTILKDGFGVSIFGNSSINGRLSVNSASISGNLTAGSANINGNTVITGTLSSKNSYMDGNNTITGKLNVQQSTVISSGLSATGNSAFFGSSYTTGNVTVLGNLNAALISVLTNISVGGNISVIGDISCDDITSLGNSSLGGNLTVGGFSVLGNDLTVNGAAIIRDSLNVYGSTYIEDTFTVTENATFNKRVTSDFTDCNHLNVRDETNIGGSLTVGNITYPTHNSPINLLDLIYPVGSVLLNIDNRDPAAYLQWGTWKQVSQGLYLTGVGTGVDTNGTHRTVRVEYDYPQGEYSHQLTINEMPSHTHNISNNGGYEASAGNDGTYNPKIGVDGTSGATGSNGYHNNMVPTFGVYVWKRIS